MRKSSILIAITGMVLILSCEKESCDCELPNNFKAIHYDLKSVLPLSYSIYTSEGLKYPPEPFDTLIRYYYFKNPPVIDSLAFTRENSGEFYTHSNRFIKEDTLVNMTSFDYSIENNSYTLFPIDLNSTYVIDESQDNYLRALIVGKDDDEIVNATKKTFEIEEDRLISEQYGIRIVQGGTTFEATLDSPPGAGLTENIKRGVELYIFHYQLEYFKK